MALQHLRSSTANKRPVPGNMSEGQLAINTASGSPGLFFRDSNSNLVKVGPVHVGTTAPNASPASGGTAGNSVGEQWLDTSSSTYVFKIWDGSAWRSEAGEFVNTTGDVMTGALGIIAGSAGSPGLYFSGDTNTGIYSPGADQVAISTNGTGRLFVDANGNLTNTRAIATAYSATNAATWTNGLSLYNSSTPGTGVCSFINFTGNANVNSAFGVTQAGSSYGDFVWASFNGSFSERMRLTAGGSLGIGTASPEVACDISGQVRASTGILFGGDTAAANALDDYEEGTFTPTIVGTSTAGTATYAANGQVGRYTKIGNRVFFDLFLSWTAHTGTGDLQINGLPFTVQNTTNLNRNYSAILNVVAMTAGNLGAAFSSPNTTAVALRQMPTGGGSVATIPMDTSAQISISGCFEA
jgi:hypothetical protein